MIEGKVLMRDTLQWRTRGHEFEDGSRLADWRKIEDSPWHWQTDGHELTFEIYEHDGQYWKLYRVRWVPEGSKEHEYAFGGQACRMFQVQYKERARSPHSGRLMEPGDFEWVRTYEVDEEIHCVTRAGRINVPRQDLGPNSK